MAGAAEIIARLQTAAAKLDEARAKAASAAQDANDAKNLVAAALEGINSGPLLAMIDQVRDGLARAASGVEPAKQRIGETAQRTRALAGN